MKSVREQFLEAYQPPSAFRSKNYFSLWVWHNGLDVRDAVEQDDSHAVVFDDIENVEGYWRGFYNPRVVRVTVIPPDGMSGTNIDDMLQALMTQYNVGMDRIVSQEPGRWAVPKELESMGQSDDWKRRHSSQTSKAMKAMATPCDNCGKRQNWANPVYDGKRMHWKPCRYCGVDTKSQDVKK